MKRYFWLIMLSILGALSLSLYFYALKLADLRVHTVRFEYVFFALFAIYVLAIALILRTKFSPRETIMIILLFALAFRLVLLFSTPTLSEDIYRYVWDGKVQAAGVNPYIHEPAARELASLKDKVIFPRLFTKSDFTPYQPAAQIFFFLSSLIGSNSVLPMKLAFILLDLGAIFLIILILKELKMDTNRVLIYAWSPLVVFEISHSGHVDALIIFLLVAAILARLKDKPILTGVLLGLAIATKVYPLVLLPAFLKKRDLKMPTALLTTMGLVYLPYLGAGTGVVRFVFTLDKATRFNAGLRYFLGQAFQNSTSHFDQVFLAISLAVMIAMAILVYLRKEKTALDFLLKLLVLSTIYIILALYVAPWYIIFIVPLLCFIVSPAWLYLTGSVVLSYLFYAQRPWAFPEWVRYVEYLPFCTLLSAEIVFRSGRLGSRWHNILVLDKLEQ